MADRFITYKPADRPECEVEMDGTWHPGEVRQWEQRVDGWWANVSWSKAPGETYLDTVPAVRVREG